MHLNNQEVRFMDKWSKMKANGQWRYMLTRGFLWGVVVGLISQLFKVWDELKAWDTTSLADTYTSADFFIRLFIYCIIGFAIQAYHWNTNTKRYNQLKRRERRSKATATSAKG